MLSINLLTLRILFPFVLLLGILTNSQIFAQSKNSHIDAEMQRLVEKGALTADQASNYIITAQHTSKTSGIEHVYFNQAINGLLVNGTESSIHLLNSKKIKYNENILKGEAFRVNGNSSPGISSKQAILSVAQQMGYKVISELNQIENKNSINQEATYTSAGISEREITAKLVYQISDSKLVLVWEFSIEEVNSSDWWNFQVNASNGQILSKQNFTVSCGLEHDHSEDVVFEGPKNKIEEICADETSFLVGSYNVYALPTETPGHSGRTNVANPDNATASPFGWHDTNGSAGAEYNYTRGNNVYAYEDGDNSGYSPNGGAGLVFNFPINTTYSNGDQSEDAAITNLFYWNNIIHDVMYQYGFDEAAGNFQENNYGNGGAGSDSVNAEAQDGSGTCNANFGTPSDGGNPTMQMYVCLPHDGDLDNGVIVHEFGHGISNRLTGGPGAAGCLQNSEQMGEGWSDFFAYMFTFQSGDTGTDARGIGTWLLNEPITGPGIRTYKYTTDIGVNPHTYNNITTTGGQSHAVGEIWAEMLWEMSWALVDVYGFDNDIYNFAGNIASDKGNVMAFALVTEGMKLQPCSPGFVDGRDAILAADVALYGGANACTIWEAFAKRGLGYSASQGSSSSVTDGTQAFDLPPNTAIFDTPLATICETQGTQTGLSGGTPAGGTYTGTGVTDNLDGTFDFDPTVGGPGSTIVTYTVLDGCSGTVVALDDSIVVTDGLPVLICQDVTVVLDGGGNATITESDVIANLSPFILTTTFAANNGQAGNMFDLMAVNDITINSFDVNMDTGVTADVAIYFKTGTWVGSDTTPGDWTLMATAPAVTSAGTNQPTALNLSMGIDVLAGNTVAFYVTLVNNEGINYVNGSNAGNVWASDANLVVYEGAGKMYPFSNTFQPRNFSGNVVYKKTDQIGLPDNCGNVVSASLSQTAFTCEDIGDVIVTVTADDGNGGISMCNATVTVEGITSTYDSGWDVAPDPGSKALFRTNYDTATFGDVTACSCEIESTSTVTVGAGGYLDIQGNILVDGTLDVQHEGSVVQRDPSAVTINNGTITVTKTTTTLNDVDFTILGSPVVGETRAGVYASAAGVRKHFTTNFSPYPNGLPNADNWADENGDNWLPHTGTLDAGAGYLVKPNLDGGSSGQYTTVYNGALNSGNIGFLAVINGGDSEISPNILSNPYASAIRVDLFQAENPGLIPAVYFWEHDTPPTVGFPGFFGVNYSMDNISYHNGIVGTACGGCGTAPGMGIPSGQGFGIKPDASASVILFTNAMRVTDLNTGYRNTESLDVLRVQVSNESYGLKSTATIGFRESNSNNIEISDIKRLGTSISLYSELEDLELGIQMRSVFNEAQIIPIGFHSNVEETQSYTISLGDLEGALISDATVYLKDFEANTLTNLSETDYTFIANEGYQSGRFVLVFESELLGNEAFSLASVSIYPNPTNNILNIVSPLAAIRNIEVVDIQGRKVNSIPMDNQGVYQLDMSSYASAIYFVKINTDNGLVTKRVLKE